MEQGYLAQVQALIDLKWKENPEEMKRVMGEMKEKEKVEKKPKVETLTQKLIEEMNKDSAYVDMSKIQALIKKGADVGAKNIWGQTPLHLATISNDIETTKFLIKRGAEVNAKNNWEGTSLHIASRMHHIEIAKLLIQNGANINTPDKNGRTPSYMTYSDEMKAILGSSDADGMEAFFKKLLE